MKTILLANLTNEPKMKTDKRGYKFVSFGVAEDTKKKNEDGTFEKTGVMYMNVTAYGDYAMQIAMNMHKGDRVELKGEAQPNVMFGERKYNIFKMKSGKILFRKGQKEITQAA